MSKAAVIEIAPSPCSKPSPWGKSPVIVPCSLEDVMSEQLAAQLQREEVGEEQQSLSSEAAGGITGSSNDDITEILAAAGVEMNDEGESDELIARMLQKEFDKEHDKMLKREEEHLNGKSKIRISFDNYKRRQVDDNDDDSDDDDEFDREEVTEKFIWDNSPPEIGGKGKNMTTKHDKTICDRQNAEKMMMFPPNFQYGDGEGMDMRLSNTVYNELKCHSERVEKHRQRLHEKKEHSTAEHAVDARTRLILYKLINNNVLSSISGTISGGKESVVFHAYGGTIDDEELPKECALKVFKTTLNEFKNREEYIHGDPRFFKDDFKKQNPRKIVKIWANKEAHNLGRMRKFSVPCPSVVVQKMNVLVMSFLGHNGVAAPKLKDAVLSNSAMEVAYDQTKQIMRRMYRACGLVHADLSEFNLMWHDNQVYVIDVSQAVDKVHFKAMEFLFRDCLNITLFFSKYGVHNVATPEELFNDITELDIQGTGVEFKTQLQRYEKDRKEAMITISKQHKEYAFDFHFDIAEKRRASALHKMGIADSDDDEEQ